jgi:D-arabinose 1-dehydrogenase-like Zn-dependent alcohol dehydrogenase
MTTYPTTCKAAALTAYGEPLEIVDVQVPQELEPGSLLVKTLSATVCATDVHLWGAKVASKDAGSNLPLILGHEMAGEVVAFGDGPERDTVGQDLKVGDRIIWTHGFCGQCYNCRIRHEPALCSHRRGYMATTYTQYPYLTGGFSEYGYVFPTSGRVRIPDEIDSDVASAASCALRTVMHGFRRLGEVEDAVVVEKGSGPLGLFAASRAVEAGAREVIVIGGPAQRLDLAKRWGASQVIDVTQVRAEERAAAVMDYTKGLGADVVIEMSGAPTAFDEGMSIIRSGGRYLLIGQIGAHPTTLSASTIVLKQLSLIGSLSGSVEDYYHALQFMVRTKDRFAWKDMISTTFDLADINDAFAGMKDLSEIKPAVRFATA